MELIAGILKFVGYAFLVFCYLTIMFFSLAGGLIAGAAISVYSGFANYIKGLISGLRGY